MARKSKPKRRRSPKTISLISMAESYGYASILLRGTMNSSPVQFITGKADLGYARTGGSVPGTVDYMTGGSTMQAVGGGSLSLGDLVSQPEQAFGIISSNVMSNYIPMMTQSLYLSAGTRIFKRLLRRPISNVNRTFMKELGLGVRL